VPLQAAGTLAEPAWRRLAVPSQCEGGRDVPGPERYPSEATGTAGRLRIGLSSPARVRPLGGPRRTGRGVAPAETARGLRVDIVQDLGRLYRLLSRIRAPCRTPLPRRFSAPVRNRSAAVRGLWAEGPAPCEEAPASPSAEGSTRMILLLIDRYPYLFAHPRRGRELCVSTGAAV